MANILIVYHSETGHTAAMARYVAEGAESVPGMEVRVLSVDAATVEDVFWADGIAAGAPVYMGLASWQMKRFWDVTAHPAWGRIDGKIGCAFASAGGWGGGNELTCMSILTMMMNAGMLVFGVPDYTGRQLTLHYGAVTAGAPEGEAEIEACRRLGKRLAQWTGRTFDGRADLHPGPIKERA